MEGSGAGSLQIITDTDPGGPNTYGSYGSGSHTLMATLAIFRLRSPACQTRYKKFSTVGCAFKTESRGQNVGFIEQENVGRKLQEDTRISHLWLPEPPFLGLAAAVTPFHSSSSSPHLGEAEHAQEIQLLYLTAFFITCPLCRRLAVTAARWHLMARQLEVQTGEGWISCFSLRPRLPLTKTVSCALINGWRVADPRAAVALPRGGVEPVEADALDEGEMILGFFPSDRGGRLLSGTIPSSWHREK